MVVWGSPPAALLPSASPFPGSPPAPRVEPLQAVPPTQLWHMKSQPGSPARGFKMTPSSGLKATASAAHPHTRSLPPSARRLSSPGPRPTCARSRTCSVLRGPELCWDAGLLGGAPAAPWSGGSPGRRRNACWSGACTLKSVTRVTPESHSGCIGSKVQMQGGKSRVLPPRNTFQVLSAEAGGPESPPGGHPRRGVHPVRGGPSTPGHSPEKEEGRGG